jgi:hypothetical protein
VLAITKASVEPISNLELLDAIVEKVHERFSGTEVYGDFKFYHDLRTTGVRLVVPEVVHEVRDGDPWSIGISIGQSVVGERPLTIQGYLFRWVCSNGAITQHNGAKYSRRGRGEGDAYEWAREVIDDILGVYEHEFEVLDELARTPIPEYEHGGNRVQSRALALMDVFETYGVPLEARERIIQQLTDSDDFTVYGIMQAVTAVANDEDVRESVRRRLMEIGGDLPRANSNRCQQCRRLPL